MEDKKVHTSCVLLVDDEPEVLELTRLTLMGEGIGNVRTIQDSRKVMSFFQQERVSVLVLDLMMPHVSGTEILSEIVAKYPEVPVIVMTASDDIETAIECLKASAFDYLLKPVEPGRLLAVVEKALKFHAMQQEIHSLKECLLSDRLLHSEAFSSIITRSKSMRAIFQYVEVIAPTTQPILITGETGVGKELIAHAIHKVSGVTGQFVPVNVAGLDDEMFSDTLFGHRKGAFTNAEESRDGLIKKAAGGTLFLDEIGDLSLKSQLKLMRLLQGQEYYPLGSDHIKKSEAHILLATNQNLAEMAEAGRFRKDLYYRLCAYEIHIPPLRERTEDLPILLDSFVEEAARGVKKEKPLLSSDLAGQLASCPFPGNIRELKAKVSDAVARHVEGPLSFHHFQKLLPLHNTNTASDAYPATDGSELLTAIFGRFPSIREMENYMIERAMLLSEGKRSKAAQLLGVTRQALHKRMKLGK